MAKQPYISHTVNGYSRYDVPESKAFTCTPGILYPVRIDFINARDRVTIAQGIDVRSNPLSVPTFNPYTIRLHRFWVPLQLYHPEMRTNSSEFDMNNLSLNFLRTYVNHRGNSALNKGEAYPNSLMAWLRCAQKSPLLYTTAAASVLSTSALAQTTWVNADPYLAYWDIVRNFYAFSQYPLYSFAWPGSWGVSYDTSKSHYQTVYKGASAYFFQRFGDLSFLDYFYESQFYPGSVQSTNQTYNRMGILYQIINSDSETNSGPDKTDIQQSMPVTAIFNGTVDTTHPNGQLPSSVQGSPSGPISMIDIFFQYHPMAVVPASPDRFSRMLPASTSGDAINISSAFTVPQLAIASRLQEYKDLLGAGGSRYSDWLETFFASRIEHVDRPKLLFSASQTVNAQVVMATAGKGISTDALGTQGGTIAFNSKLGREQSYFFREPGYLIDMLSIRPVYYWQNIQPDYLRYQGADYFNPLYNDIGYQDVPLFRFSNPPTDAGGDSVVTIYREPCFNEFRASYDEALGQFGSLSTSTGDLQRWVQTRGIISIPGSVIEHAFSEIPTLFTDISTVNTPFAVDIQDNFFINLSYSIRKKNLVNKSFATRLANR